MNKLEPRSLWEHFFELCRIPRGTGNEAAAAKWVLARAQAVGCDAAQDKAGNVLIRKPATPGRENAPITALQAHVDMVCEQREGACHDFLHDPILPYRDGDLIRARGTTLGADNGIGVAAALAVLGSRDLRHGPLEVLITVDEEGQWAGASALKPGTLQARYLLNLDSGKQGFLTIGCAGGMESLATRMLCTRPSLPGRGAFRLDVKGLRGGHSAIAIHEGRGNAIHLLARVLWNLASTFDLEIVSLDGGDKPNAIPRSANAQLLLGPQQEGPMRRALAEMETDLRQELGAFDPQLWLTLNGLPQTDSQVLEDQESRNVLGFLLALRHGVTAYSPTMPGLVESSTNLAAMSFRTGTLQIRMLHRSSLVSALQAITEQTTALCELAGFEVRHEAGFPAWKPEPNGQLVRLALAVYASAFDHPMALRATHGGLESGLIGANHPGLEMVSFGPELGDTHTPDEHVNIPSVAAFWTFLNALLEQV